MANTFDETAEAIWGAGRMTHESADAMGFDNLRSIARIPGAADLFVMDYWFGYEESVTMDLFSELSLVELLGVDPFLFGAKKFVSV